MKLRPYQKDFENDIYEGWASGAKNVLGVLPTGAGKTVSFAKILGDHNGKSVATAHRQELVSQIALALAQRGLPHQIVGPMKVVQFAVQRQMDELGTSTYRAGSDITVVGVDTLTRRAEALASWAKTVTLWVQDEAHHLLLKNKWGKATKLFPNALGFGATATPTRSDGRGLGRTSDGVMDVMVEGPGMRELIVDCYLTDYRIFAPPSTINLSKVKITASGDYSKPQLKTVLQKSQIVGDVVEHYKKIAPGKLGITFASDIELATQIAEQYRQSGVPAEVVSHKTPDNMRADILKRFRNRSIMQLVNVDLFGEGFDLPAIEVVSMARPTESYPLYCQQFGRALRLMLGTAHGCDLSTRAGRLAAIAGSIKPKAIIIDHVGNISRHLLPDAKRKWTLNRRDGRGRMDPTGLIPVATCLNPMCFSVYERILPACPFCGHVNEPADRSKPEFVDGDLCELSPDALAQLRGEVDAVDKDVEDYRAELVAKHAPHLGVLKNVKYHANRQVVQSGLRSAMAWMAGKYKNGGLDMRAQQKRFFYDFGIDVLSAQALAPKDAVVLTEQIIKELMR